MRRAGAALATLAALPMVAGCAGAGDEPRPVEPPALVGTWRLLDVVDVVDVVDGDSAAARRPFGAGPEGYVVYDPTGRVFVHVRRRLAADVPRRDWSGASRAHLLEIVESYAASFGTYAVDSVARVVTHAIEGESPPATGVLERATPYDVRGDTLRIGGGQRRWTFVRVR